MRGGGRVDAGGLMEKLEAGVPVLLSGPFLRRGVVDDDLGSCGRIAD